MGVDATMIVKDSNFYYKSNSYCFCTSFPLSSQDNLTNHKKRGQNISSQTQKRCYMVITLFYPLLPSLHVITFIKVEVIRYLLIDLIIYFTNKKALRDSMFNMSQTGS